MAVNDIRRAWEDVMELALELDDVDELRALRDRLRSRRIALLKNGPYWWGEANLPTETDLHMELALDEVLELEDPDAARRIRDELRRGRMLGTRHHSSQTDREVDLVISSMANTVLPGWACVGLRDLDSPGERLVVLLERGRRKAIDHGLLSVLAGPEISDELVFDFALEVLGRNRSEVEPNQEEPSKIDHCRDILRSSIAFARERGLLDGEHGGPERAGAPPEVL